MEISYKISGINRFSKFSKLKTEFHEILKKISKNISLNSIRIRCNQEDFGSVELNQL